MSLWLEGFFCVKKTTSWACFEASELNNIFHLYPHFDILDKSSLKHSDEELKHRQQKV